MSDERPPLQDSNPDNGRPDYVDRTIANTRVVWATALLDYGYKRPLRDTASGGHNGGNPNGRVDIFIANVGNAEISGYCTTDDPRVGKSARRRNSAFCVIDDDFSSSDFPSGPTRNAANKVTLARELFHAVQFGYDTFDTRAMI